MKILYTKSFKEAIDLPWKRLSLNGVKLRGGKNTGLTSRKDLLKSLVFPKSFLETNITSRFYDTEYIRLKKGIQLCFQVSESDNSFYNEDNFYQVLLFFYTDFSLSIPVQSLAFVCYENISEENSKLTFTDLNLTTKKNIITIPDFSWKANIDFNQSDTLSFLEDSRGNLERSSVLGEKEYVSLDSWKSWIIDSISEPVYSPWIETMYLNKFGIKIY